MNGTPIRLGKCSPVRIGVPSKLVRLPNAQRRAGHPRSSPPPLRGDCLPDGRHWAFCNLSNYPSYMTAWKLLYGDETASLIVALYCTVHADVGCRFFVPPYNRITVTVACVL
ncbi:MAG: hypothetical protein LBQ66_04665 [Planctomycetaceae bacterium]|nr:hypothetical protein [Planctomycetaceae bacterium]